MQQESEHLLLHIEWVVFKGSVKRKKQKQHAYSDQEPMLLQAGN